MAAALAARCAPAVKVLPCSSNADCTVGYQCQPTGECIKPPRIDSSSGGSSGGTTGHATGATTGSVTGASSGASTGSSSTGTGSSGASSGGSGASSGSTGGAAQTVKVNFINASANHTGALDLCIFPTGSALPDAGIAGAGGVAYQHTSAFANVASAASTLRLVAAGSDCATSLFSVDSADVTAYVSTTHTVVVWDTGSDNNFGFTLIHDFVGVASDANITFVETLVPAVSHDTSRLSLATPSTPLISGAPQSLLGGDLLYLQPLSNALLLSKSSTKTLAFAGFNAAADTVLSVIVAGNENATDASAPTLLICDEGGDSPSCTTIAATTPPTFLRFANLSSDGGEYFYWAQADGDGFAAAPSAHLVAGQVSAYGNLSAASSIDVCVTTTNTAPNADCTSSVNFASQSTFGPDPGGYELYEVSGSLAHTLFGGVIVAPPLVDDGITLALTVVDTLTDNGAFLSDPSISAPAEDGLPIVNGSRVADWAWANSVELPIDYYDSVSGDFIRFTSDDDSGVSFGDTVLFGGDTHAVPYLLLCDSAGTLNAQGDSNCTTAFGTSIVRPAYLRFIQSSHLFESTDICLGAAINSAKVFSNFFDYDKLGPFVSIPVTTSDIYVVPAGDFCNTPASLHVAMPALTAGSYYTLALSGVATGSGIVSPATPPTVDVANALVSVADDWPTPHDNTLAFTLGAQPLGESVSYTAATDTPTLTSDVYTTVTLPLSSTTLTVTNSGADGGAFNYKFDAFYPHPYPALIYRVLALPPTDPQAAAPDVWLCVENLNDVGYCSVLTPIP